MDILRMRHSEWAMGTFISDTAVHWAAQLYGPFYSKTKSDDHRARVMTSAELFCDRYMA